MIIKVEIVVTDREMRQLKARLVETTVATCIGNRVASAVNRGEFETYEWVDDHAVDPNTGQLVTVGKVKVKLDN